MSGETLAKNGVGPIIESAHMMETDKAVVFHGKVYFTKMNQPATYDDVMKEIELLQQSAAACKKEGVKLAYHNHDPEFRMSFNGMTVFDMLLATRPICGLSWMWAGPPMPALTPWRCCTASLRV